MGEVSKDEHGEQSAQCDESSLVRAAKADPNAFDAIYVRYVSRVYRFMYTQTSSDEDALDLTQLVFLKAIDALPRYKERGLPFASWLFRISRNVANDFHRQRERSTTVSWGVLPEELHPMDPTDFEQEVLKRQVQSQELGRVKVLLEQLDGKQRELIAMRFSAGLTLSQIARVVKRSQGSVQREIVRILQQLKQQYNQQFREQYNEE